VQLHRINRTLQQIHDYRAASIAVLRASACAALHAKSGSALESLSAFYSPGHVATPVPSCRAGTATATAFAWNPEKQQSASASASAFAWNPEVQQSASREEGLHAHAMAPSTNGGNKALLDRG
jgi:hypothetical protein